MIIGNILSFFAALFMVASCVVKRKQAIFFCQFLECALLAVASVFFGSLAGMTTLVLSAIRNLVVAKNRYTKPVMVAFVILTIVAGLLANTRGLVGLLPILATVEYTICCHYIEGETATKCSIFVNVLLWIVYSFLICDFSTAISDSIVLVVDTVSIVRLWRSERSKRKCESTADGQT